MCLPGCAYDPLFTVYAEEEERLHVYYGLELLEVVSADREDPSFKMLVGRLYNAGLNRRVLSETFQVDPKTMQGWGRALRCGDARQLVRVLAGVRAKRKLTAEIEAYVRARWSALSAQGTYGISGRISREIQSVFQVKLSTVALRPLVGSLKQGEGLPQAEPAAWALGPAWAKEAEAAAGEGTTASRVSDWEQTQPSAQALSSSVGESACGCGRAGLEVVAPSETRTVALPSEPLASPTPALEASPQTLGCDHAGVLLFAPTLVSIAPVLDPPEPMFKQWLASLLLGALNIEQTKFLNGEDLERLLGSIIRFAHPQRQQLQRVATEASFAALLGFNARQIGAEGQTDFYFDPHTKHYTGAQPVLKGWCPAIRFADKALHSDFVHTVAGQPLYFETTDNFADLRQRFFGVVDRCRAVLGWPPERGLTFVVDRSIFGIEVFEKVLADPHLHLITWEKGYGEQSWPPACAEHADRPAGGVSGRMVIERARNRADDVRWYHLEFVDRPWPKDPRLRQLVVRATNPKGQTIQVAILTDDLSRPAMEILRLMFNRWIQENDFKYLDKHFGINQITSYRAIPYEQLRQQVQDRQVRSGEHKALSEQRGQLRARQARLLLVQEQCDHKAARRQERIQRLEGQSHPVPDQEWAQLRRAQTRYQALRQERREQIEQWSRELAELEPRWEQAQQKVSRLDSLIAQNMVRLEPSQKRLMDLLRIIARNAFYAALAPFKKAYDNYRDDHDYFRQLTQACGVLEVQTQQIVVHLMPRVNYSPQLRRIIGGVLEQINAQEPPLPDGSGRRLKLRLGRRSELKLSLQVEGDFLG
ncbi:MAG: hypothetical protein HY296_02640 [Thaumarchaeota archaeon]|nr:hypothetical protein [Nitrososphaerota archaeon]